MGGKHKQAQRIKNNARPSSSGRSAELLASSSQAPQFSVKEIRFVPPTLSLMKMEEFDTSVSPDFQIIFKRMNKKDCTTKIKALQEFSDLIASSETEAVKTILTFWTTLYSILATDTDHRVREAVHNAQYQIVSKDKKIIAPYLKQLIGPWFTSQYDSYPPAASAASKAFSAAFPENKVQGCVVFCQKEILTYIHDNLTSKLDTSSKNASNEDIEAKFERVIVSSLQGYCLYLETLTCEQIEKNTELNKQIISNSRFVKLATHKTAVIRATWFKVLATLYHKAPFLLNGEDSHVVPIVFNNLDENEPAVVGFVWEALLLIMERGEEWWKHVQVEKIYLSKLKKVLREGGQGSASVIYPNLLSLLHKLPPTLRAEQFYDTFFENVRIGLRRKSILSSRSESTAVVTALVECLQFVILTNQTDTDLCERLIKTQLMPLIEWSLNADQVCYRTVFHQVALLVQYWNRNKDKENYSQYLNSFWTDLIKLFESPFEEENQDLADRQVIFLQNLKHTAKPKEQMKVKFSEEGEASHETHTTANRIDESYNESMTQLAYAVVKGYVRHIDEKKSKFLLQSLFSTVRLFESRGFLLGLSRNFTEDQSEDLLSIYQKLLYKWLKTPEVCSESVVDLIFILVQYTEDKDAILTSLLEFAREECFLWCVKNAFSHPHNRDSVVQKWIKSPQVGEFLLTTTDINLAEECPVEFKNLFKLAFTENQDGDLLIEKETISRIIRKLEAPILHPEEYLTSIDSCAHLASYVTDIVYTDTSLMDHGEGLLLALFRFSCEDHSDLELLTEDTRYEINTSWQDVVTTLSKNLTKEDLVTWIEKFAQLVEVIFSAKSPTEGVTNHLIEAIVNFVKAVFEGQPLFITQVLQLFFDRAFLPTWKNKIEELCWSVEYLNGKLAAPESLKKIKTEAQVSDEEIFKYFVWAYIKISVLCSPLRTEEEDDEEEGEVAEVKEVIYSVDDNPEVMVGVVHDLAMCQSFLNSFKMTPHFTEINQQYEKTKDKVVYIIEKLKIPDEIKQVLVNKCNSEPVSWMKTLYLYNEDILLNDEESVYSDYRSRLTNDLCKLHLGQLYGSFINFDYVDPTSSVFDSIVTLRSLNLAYCDGIEVQIAEAFEKIKKLRSQDIARFLFENKDLSWHYAETVIEVIRLFSRLVKEKFDYLSRQHWDFGVICLSSWATNCYKLRANHDNDQIRAFMVAVTQFYITLNEKMAEFKQNNVKNAFVEEWEDIFLPSIHAELLQLWLYLAEQFASRGYLAMEDHPFLQEFGRVGDHFVHKLIFNRDNNLPSWSKILKRCATLLVNSSAILQLWGYKMLLVLVPGLIEIDLQSDNSDTPNTKGFTLEQFKEILLQTHTVVDGVLTGFKLGEDSCQVTPFTDSYTYVFAYSLLWAVFLDMCEKSPPKLRYQYADWLSNENYFKDLLNNLFKLMPSEILHYSEGKAKAFTKLFLKKPALSFEEPCSSEYLEHLACWIYASCLDQLPALVRQWWSETESKVTQIVERVTALYVSPQLCTQELVDVRHRENTFKNMTIKIIPSVREVIAIYTVDEAQMELVITLPQNYPLGGPVVRCSRQIGGPLHKQWLMQLKKYLLHQNGRIWDGLSLWNSSLDKKFDGVEECYICFAVLHPGTYQLPKLSCQTCKKKFHSACLYKWFSTSNKSSCPICRNLF